MKIDLPLETAKVLIREFMTLDDCVDVDIYDCTKEEIYERLDLYYKGLKANDREGKRKSRLWSDGDWDEPSTRCYAYIEGGEYKLLCGTVTWKNGVPMRNASGIEDIFYALRTCGALWEIDVQDSAL